MCGLSSESIRFRGVWQNFTNVQYRLDYPLFANPGKRIQKFYRNFMGKWPMIHGPYQRYDTVLLGNSSNLFSILGSCGTCVDSLPIRVICFRVMQWKWVWWPQEDEKYFSQTQTGRCHSLNFKKSTKNLNIYMTNILIYWLLGREHILKRNP